LELRPYQQECITALWDFWKQEPQGRPLLVCPTGAGKSILIAEIIRRISEKYPTFKFIVATHTKEIVSQNASELQRLMPNERIGIYSASLGSKDLRRVTFANVQSIYKKNLEADILIIDEAHLLSRNESSMYQKLISSLQQNNPYLKIFGTTATPMRVDQGSLTSEGSTFTDIAYDIGIRKLIEDGYLSPLISFGKEAVDLSQVKTSGYDYNQTDLQLAFNRDALIDGHCQNILEATKNRKSILVFCAGILHAESVAKRFCELGVSADFVTGEMLPFERDNKIDRFKRGETKILCNVAILTTGFNHKAIDCVVLLRATKSASLYIQMVGRGTRTCDGKENCLVLDYGGNIDRFGPIDCVTVKTKKGQKAEIGVVPTKKCPGCGCVVVIRVSYCPSCEYEFPEGTKELEVKATNAPILSQVEEAHIKYTEYKRHQKAGKPDSLMIKYVGDKLFFDFLCFEHGGFASAQASKKWVSRGGQMPAPRTIEEALERRHELFSIDGLKAIKRGKYYEILEVSKAPEREMDEWGDFV
jgi:DNA repair protein RadD